jgi:hypothetical protein
MECWWQSRASPPTIAFVAKNPKHPKTFRWVSLWLIQKYSKQILHPTWGPRRGARKLRFTRVWKHVPCLWKLCAFLCACHIPWRLGPLRSLWKGQALLCRPLERGALAAVGWCIPHLPSVPGQAKKLFGLGIYPNWYHLISIKKQGQ